MIPSIPRSQLPKGIRQYAFGDQALTNLHRSNGLYNQRGAHTAYTYIVNHGDHRTLNHVAYGTCVPRMMDIKEDA